LYQDKKVGGVWGKAPMGVKKLRACPAKMDYRFQIQDSFYEQRTTNKEQRTTNMLTINPFAHCRLEPAFIHTT
jgi:hypothetical protein